MKMLQINDGDLRELERILPEWATMIGDRVTPRTNTQVRVVQRILTSVRWNYTPWEKSEVVNENPE
jgi:hypothetical protein